MSTADKPVAAEADEPRLPLPTVRCLTKEQAAEYLGIGVTLLMALGVPHLKFGRRCVFDKLDLDNWLEDYKQREHRRAGKEKDLWPKTLASIADPTPGSGGLPPRFPMADAYAKALGLKAAKKHKPC